MKFLLHLLCILFLFYQNNTRNLFKPLKQSKLLIKIIISSGLGTFIALSFWIVGYAHIEHPPIASLLGQTSVIFITVLSVVFLIVVFKSCICWQTHIVVYISLCQ